MKQYDRNTKNGNKNWGNWKGARNRGGEGAKGVLNMARCENCGVPRVLSVQKTGQWGCNTCGHVPVLDADTRACLDKDTAQAVQMMKIK